MAKTCSICKKSLTFRNAFVYQNNEVCRDCLEKLEAGQKIEDLKRAGRKEPSGSSNRYPALRSVSNLYRLMAILVLVFTIPGFIFGFTSTESNSFLNAPILFVFLIVFGILSLTLFAFAEGIEVFIDIEQNTRQTLYILYRRIQSK